MTHVPKTSGSSHRSDALAPLRRASVPWTATTLGQWNLGTSPYALERFSYAGPSGGGDVLRVGIFAGLHGDEVAGVHALVNFLERLAEDTSAARGYEIHAYPLCNPTGFEDGTRHARSGADLNREFWMGSGQPEVQLLERELRTLRFDGLIALHADCDSPGLYAFALGSEVTRHVVEPALAAAEQVLPRNLDPIIDNFTARNGLIRKGYPGMLCAAPEARPRPFEIVFETPQLAPLDRQVDANLVFLRQTLEQYLQLRAVQQDL